MSADPSIAELMRGDAKIAQQERKYKYRLYGELEAESRKEQLVHGLLGAGEGSAWYGVPGCGKSAIVEDMALKISSGREWLGRQVKQGSVLYVALERRQLVERRAIAFRERHQIFSLPFAVIGGMLNLRNPKNTATIVGAAKELEQETDTPIALVIIDTISRALCGGDENSPKDMGAIVAATSRIQNDTRAHVLWVHHMPQDGSERLRGHGALLGAMDTTVYVEKLSGGVRSATVVKANDSEEGAQVTFTFERVTIGPDTTAPVVVPADPAIVATLRPKRHQKLSDRAKLALSALSEALISHGQSAAPSLELPAGTKTVTIGQWREEMSRQSVIPREHKNPTVAFDRVCNSLAASRLIGLRDEFVWAVVT